MRVIARLLCAVTLLPSLAAAMVYDTSHLPYPDTPEDRETAVALSTLTAAGIVAGHEDGYFRGGDLLNRAEFVKIVLGLLPPSTFPVILNCFPDVDPTAWYAEPVCQAKQLGLVEGDDLPGGTKQFAPGRNINYAEAVKVLVLTAEIPIVRREREAWYAGFLHAADVRDLTLRGLQPADFISRSEMVRLAAGFLAFERGELTLLRSAQNSTHSSSSSVSSSSSSLSNEASSSTSVSAQFQVTYDADANVAMRDDFLQLNTISPVLAAANIFSNSEPLDVKEIKVSLVSDVSSIDSFLVYDQDAAYLGRAMRTGNAEYKLFLADGLISIPHREEFSFYVRAQLKAFTAGGKSGEDIQVQSLGITADGSWSNREYTQATTETFNQLETARSVITTIENVGDAEGILVGGTAQELASFRFSGKKGDGSSDLRVTSLTFQIEQTGGVTLSNVQLGSAGISDRMSCAVAGTVVTCTSIAASFGSFEDEPRVLRLYGDIAVPESASNPSLRMTLNERGTISSIGSVSWTDGTTTFSWVPGESPVARGTHYKG